LIPGKPDQILIEPSSGNTGIALAMSVDCAATTSRSYCVERVTERRQLLLAWGAEIIDSPGAEGSNGAVRLAQSLSADNPDWTFLYQYANPANPKRTTAHRTRDPGRRARDHPLRRRSRHLGHVDGRGTISSRARPEVQIWAVEPPSGEMVDGLRNLDDG